MAKHRDMEDREGHGTAGKVAAEGTGGVAGAAGGAAIGSLAGPVGTFVGALAGAVGGWWAGKNVAENVQEFDADDEYFRTRFEGTKGTGSIRSYDQARPLYQLGYLASRNPDYRGRSFDDIEPDLKRSWSDDVRGEYGDWDTARTYASDAFTRGRSRETEIPIQRRDEMNR